MPKFCKDCSWKLVFLEKKKKHTTFYNLNYTKSFEFSMAGIKWWLVGEQHSLILQLYLYSFQIKIATRNAPNSCCERIHSY